jgi:HAD superfamily hydrolase (TIGR01490 family)
VGGEAAGEGEAAEAMSAMRTVAAAFFDLEKTITPHAVEQEVALALWRGGTLPVKHLVRVGLIYAKYNLGWIADFDAMKRQGAVAFTGREVAGDLATYAALFERHLEPAIHAEARAAIAAHRAAGDAVYIVSSTYAFMIAPYARALAVDGFFGVRPSQRDGRFTGELEGVIPHQEGKAAIVHELAAREGLDLASSSAYGDSLNDLPMLEAVGRPFAVNPARGLRREAEARGWPILAWGARRG